MSNCHAADVHRCTIAQFVLTLSQILDILRLNACHCKPFEDFYKNAVQAHATGQLANFITVHSEELRLSVKYHTQRKISDICNTKE